VTITRLRSAGAVGQIVLRADSRFYLADVVAACRAAEVRFSIGARIIGNLRSVTEAIPEEAWTPIPYFLPDAGGPRAPTPPSAPGQKAGCAPNAARAIRCG